VIAHACHLHDVQAIVGDAEREVLASNPQAPHGLQCAKRLEVVPGATHWFEEPGTPGRVALLADDCRALTHPRAVSFRRTPWTIR
jgi:hypothetical protein